MTKSLYDIQWHDHLPGNYPLGSPGSRYFSQESSNTIIIKISDRFQIDFVLRTKLPDHEVFNTPIIVPDEHLLDALYYFKACIMQLHDQIPLQKILYLFNCLPRIASESVDFYNVHYSAEIIYPHHGLPTYVDLEMARVILNQQAKGSAMLYSFNAQKANDLEEIVDLANDDFKMV